MCDAEDQRETRSQQSEAGAVKEHEERLGQMKNTR